MEGGFSENPPFSEKPPSITDFIKTVRKPYKLINYQGVGVVVVIGLFNTNTSGAGQSP